jgi:hypothetical protein
MPDVTARTRHGRLKLFLILLACAAPVLLSYFSYYVIRPDARHLYGELIEPQKDLPSWDGIDLQGGHTPLSQLRGQWLLIAVGSGACAADCERTLFVQRQLHTLLNKDRERMDRVWLVTDGIAPKTDLLTAIQGTSVLKVMPDALGQWLAAAPGRTLSDHLYLVDPMGHWMMRFPSPEDAKAVSAIKKDLERLMRASSSWDQPGR